MKKSEIELGQVVVLPNGGYGIVIAKDEKFAQFRGDLNEYDIIIVPVKRTGFYKVQDVRFIRSFKT